MPTLLRLRSLARASLTTALSLLALPAAAQSLSLLDARVVEGDAGDALMVFEARLSAPASRTVFFDLNTSNGTASSGGTMAGDDYRLFSVGALRIPAGQTRLLVSVAVNGDTAVEANEFFNATISNVVGASLGRATAKGLIVNDDNKMLVNAPVDPAAQSGSTTYASDFSALSGDGRYVAFVSSARDLVEGRPANMVKNVYVRDTRTGVTTLASVAASGGDADGDSSLPVLSADGRYLLFQSFATNLVANDSNGTIDAFRRDLLTGTTTLISADASGSGAASGSKPSMSPDGRFVVFSSGGQIIAGVDNLGRPQVYRRDMQTGEVVLASRDASGTLADPQGGSAPHVSADGRYISYDRNGTEPWYRDMQTGVSTSAVFSYNSQQPVGTHYNYGISGDGRYVLYVSWSSNLDPACGGSSSQVYLADMFTHTTRCASLLQTGVASFSAFYPSLSTDGRYVAFQASGAPIGQPWDGSRRIFVRDMQADTTTIASVPWQGGTDNGGDSEAPSISGDGRVVSFLSYAPTMLPGDGNGQADVFRVDLPQDPSLPRLSIADATVLEGNSGTRQMEFTASLSAPAPNGVGFNVMLADGSATLTDYSQNSAGLYIPAGQTSATFVVDIYGDTTVEQVETFNAYLQNVTNGVLVGDGRAVGVIGNDDYPATPSLSIGDVTISEGNSGTKQATFTVSLAEEAPWNLAFDIATADGTASAGSDYVAAAVTGLTIPTGSTSASFSVTINGDAVYEGNESFLVNLSHANNANIADAQAVGTITNDDVVPSIAISDVTVTEGNSGTKLATFMITLSAASTSPVTYDVATSSGNATAGSDYLARSLAGQVIPAGATSAAFAVTINGDTAVEPDEAFSVNLANVSGATLADGQGVGIISNDDVTLSIADVSVAEGNSGTSLATFTVQLSGPASAPVSYNILTADGSAVAGSDYVSKVLLGQVIPAGASSGSFTVAINGDSAVEPNETFSVNITAVSGATVDDSQGIGTIANDDALPTLSIADVSIAEGNKGSVTATFTVSLSAAATGTVGFNIATANGTAVAPGDYTAKSANAQSIPAGTLSKTFAVSIKPDKTVEPNETFLVNLSGVTGPATLADGQAVGTILNDDGAALSLARVTTGGLYDDIDDRHREPVLAPKDYALLLLDAAQKVCARDGGASIVAVDGVENLAVLADLADTANRQCARRPNYSAVLKQGELGFLVDGMRGKADPRGTQVLELGAAPGTTAVKLLADGHARALTVLLAATPSAHAGERKAQAKELDRMLRARFAADPQARLVVLGAGGLTGLADLSARSLPGIGEGAERVWVSPAVLAEFAEVRLELPQAPAREPSQQVLHLLP